MPDFQQEIEVDDDSINPETGFSDEVAIVIDSTPYKFWETVEINFSLDNIADTFTISGPFNFDNSNFLSAFKPYQYKEIGLYVAGNLMLTGTLLTPSPSSNGSSSTISVSGYSTTGIISDCNVSPLNWPISINGLDLQEIANKLTGPYDIEVIFDGVSPGAKFSKSDKVRMEPDETVGSFLIKLAKQRGLIINANMEGQLVFHKITQERASLSIVGGKWPWIGSNPTFDGQSMFSDITALGTNNKKGAGQKAIVDNPALSDINPARHKVFKASDIAAGGLQDAAKAELGRMLANSVKINLSCVGWHRPDGEVWKDNQKIIYQSDRDLLISEGEYIIRNAKLSKGPSAAKTDLELVLPESYSGEIPSSFPWE